MIRSRAWPGDPLQLSVGHDHDKLKRIGHSVRVPVELSVANNYNKLKRIGHQAFRLNSSSSDLGVLPIHTFRQFALPHAVSFALDGELDVKLWRNGPHPLLPWFLYAQLRHT